MAKITRAFQKIFADGITATGNIAEFGSLAEGSPQYSKDPVQIQSRAAWLAGWAAATIGNQSPAFQDFNAYHYLISRQIAYLLQAGIAEWDADTVYYTNSFCQVAGVVYKSKIDNNQGNAVGENASWGVWISSAGLSGSYSDLTNKPSGQLAAAWVNFSGIGSNGTNMTIRSSYNVSSVNKIATGIYRLTFSSNLANANYATLMCIDGNGYACVEESGGSYVDKTVTGFRLGTKTNNGTNFNYIGVSVSVFST